MVGSRASAAGKGDVRGQILASATRLFAAQGFDGTPLQAVADEVGVAKQSLLHHFPSKEALRREVLGQMFAHWNRMLPALLMAATAADDRWEAVVGALLSFFEADPGRARLLVREALDRPGELRPLLAEHVRPFLAAVAGYIRKGQRHGEHHADADAEAYALGVVVMVVSSVAMGGLAEGLLDPGEGRDPMQRHLAEVRRLAKAGLFVGAGRADGGGQQAAARGSAAPRGAKKARRPRRG